MPAARRGEVQTQCEALQQVGHIAHCQEADVGGQRFIRLRLGAFSDRTAAGDYAAALAAREGFDYLIVQANVFVDSFGEAFDIITTPGGIWQRSPTTTKRLYRFPTASDVPHHGPAAIAPDGRAVAFCHDNAILKIDLANGAVTTLHSGRDEDELFQSIVAFSPDGQHLAYLDCVGWERPTCLWIVRTHGGDRRVLASDRTKATKVKSFGWHPQSHSLFYVAGPTHGTVSVGGRLYSVDLAGQHHTLLAAPPDERTEIDSHFHIADGQLHYRLAHFDPQGRLCRYSDHTLALTAETP